MINIQTPPHLRHCLPRQVGPLRKHVHWRPLCLPASFRQQHTTHLIHGKKGRITILINHRPTSAQPSLRQLNKHFVGKHGVRDVVFAHSASCWAPPAPCMAAACKHRPRGFSTLARRTALRQSRRLIQKNSCWRCLVIPPCRWDLELLIPHLCERLQLCFLASFSEELYSL